MRKTYAAIILVLILGGLISAAIIEPFPAMAARLLGITPTANPNPSGCITGTSIYNPIMEFGWGQYTHFIQWPAGTHIHANRIGGYPDSITLDLSYYAGWYIKVSQAASWIDYLDNTGGSLTANTWAQIGHEEFIAAFGQPESFSFTAQLCPKIFDIPSYSIDKDRFGCYDMEEVGGPRYDWTINNNHLTQVSGTSIITSTDAIIGNGAYFYQNYTWKHLYITDTLSTSIGANKSFSIAAWVRPECNNCDMAVVAKVGEYILQTTTAGKFAFKASYDNVHWLTVTSQTSYTTGNWYFLVGVYDDWNHTINIYVSNNTPQMLNFPTGGVPDTSNNLFVGLDGSQLPWHGAMDEVMIWRRALADNEITWLYNGGNGQACGATTSNEFVFGDGNMEQYPHSSYWYGDLPFGRLNINNPAVSQWNGYPYCGNGWQVIGKLRYSSTIYEKAKPISQSFDWPGGTMYWSYAVRAGDAYGIPLMTLRQTSSGQVYTLDNQTPWTGWTVVTGSGDFPADQYTLKIENELDDGIIYIDEVQVSQSPITTGCVPGGAGTPQPTPVSSPTPTPTGTAYQFRGLANCNFEQGYQGWEWSSTHSYIGNGGGPIGSHYGATTNDDGFIKQQFVMPVDDFLYITGWTAYNPYIEIRRIGSYPLDYQLNVDRSGASWLNFTDKILIPKGNYEIILSSPEESDPFAAFDGIYIALGNYADCPGEPDPTSIVRTPTLTLTPINPTDTPYPSNTPAPTVGPGTPTPTYPVVTPPAQPRNCDDPCIRPKFDPLYYDEPAGFPLRAFLAYIGWWIEYILCELLKFFMWCPRHTEIIVGAQSTLTAKEPLGTIIEFKGAAAGVADVITSYDYDDPCLVGSQQSPNIAMFNAPDVFNGEPIVLFPDDVGSFSTECQCRLGDRVGTLLKRPICFIFNVLVDLMLIQWLQFFINLMCIVALWIYVKKYIHTLES